VVRHAYEFNCPMTLLQGTPSTSGPWFHVDTPHLILDTVKKAEDSDALILRLYEAYGTSGKEGAVRTFRSGQL
jgi:alpha-mannosidase